MPLTHPPAPPWSGTKNTFGGVTRLRKGHLVIVTFDRPGADTKKGHGTIDTAQRLYQHGSKNGRSAYRNCMPYGLHDEFALVAAACDWMEFIDFAAQQVWRISVGRAMRGGHAEETPNGARWLVPVDQYEVVPRGPALR